MRWSVVAVTARRAAVCHCFFLFRLFSPRVSAQGVPGAPMFWTRVVPTSRGGVFGGDNINRLAPHTVLS